jgi:hypothetical protein
MNAAATVENGGNALVALSGGADVEDLRAPGAGRKGGIGGGVCV